MIPLPRNIPDLQEKILLSFMNHRSMSKALDAIGIPLSDFLLLARSNPEIEAIESALDKLQGQLLAEELLEHARSCDDPKIKADILKFLSGKLNPKYDEKAPNISLNLTKQSYSPQINISLSPINSIKTSLDHLNPPKEPIK